MRHFNIPVFISELACPQRCVYCNQHKITSQLQIPGPRDVKKTIEAHLTTIPKENRRVEVAFFGGNFTGLEPDKQQQYLGIVQPYFKLGLVDGIRISTRPDYINQNIIDFLKPSGVSSIELGVQSLDGEVLRESGRGYTVEDVFVASRLIAAGGFELGLQMMTGLPGDSPEKSIDTASQIIKLGAKTTRIYPCLVIRGTKLEQMFYQGLYKPQVFTDAVQLAARLYMLFIEAGVRVLKVGLHPSETLLRGRDLVAGPFHVSFGQIIKSKVWGERIKHYLAENNINEGNLSITLHPSQIPSAIGHKAENRLGLLGIYRNVNFAGDLKLAKHEFRVDCN